MLSSKRSIVTLAFVLFLSSPCYSQTAEEYLRLGNDTFKEGAFDQAIVDYTKAIDNDPNLTKAYDNRGVAYAKEGSFRRAIADFTMAIANDPKDPEAYNNRGLAYAQLGDSLQAVRDYTKAIEADTFYVKAYNNREMAYYQLKEYAKAWGDVHTVEAIGGSVDPNFIEELKKVYDIDHHTNIQ